MLQSCDKNDDGNNRQQDTTLNESNNSNNRGSDNGGVNDNGKDSYKECPDTLHPHMIDLGLPSGTLWACCNVGANAPEEYGNYYAWGETNPKSVYDWNTYKWGNENSLTKYSTISDYGTVDGKTILDVSDDVATANWGNPWQMPTITQIEELLNKTTFTWTTENGEYGLKLAGSNGGSIFLPAAGRRWGTDLITGSSGIYWSSTLFEGDPNFAFSLYFYSGKASWNRYIRHSRSIGLSVRPVCQKN